MDKIAQDTAPQKKNAAKGKFGFTRIANAFVATKRFFAEVKLELIKCSWPPRKELVGSSVVVIVSVIILGACVGLFDLWNMWLMKWIIR